MKIKGDEGFSLEAEMEEIIDRDKPQKCIIMIHDDIEGHYYKIRVTKDALEEIIQGLQAIENLMY